MKALKTMRMADAFRFVVDTLVCRRLTRPEVIALNMLQFGRWMLCQSFPTAV
jgi:hypothetical protein